MVFALQLSPDGKSISVDDGLDRAEFLLGDSPALGVLRRHPELLAAAFAYGYVPEAEGVTPAGAKLPEYLFDVGAQ
jgi:hypothetical protein